MPEHDLIMTWPDESRTTARCQRDGRVGLTCPVSDLSQAAPRRLAAIAWHLYAEAGLGEAEIDGLRCILRSFRSPGSDPAVRHQYPACSGR